MAIKTFTSRYDYLTSGNLNQKTDKFLSGNYLLSPVNITTGTTSQIIVEDFAVNLDGVLVYVDSADIIYSHSSLSEPYYLCLTCESNFNVPQDTIITFDTSSAIFSGYMSGEGLALSSDALEGAACIEFDKNSIHAEAGILVDAVTDISSYIGIGAKIKIPTGKASTTESISIIVDESGDLSNYTRYDTTSGIVDGWNNVHGMFVTPSASVGTNAFQSAQKIYIYVTMSPAATTFTAAAVDHLYGLLVDPNTKLYDDGIEARVTDLASIGFILATYNGGWTASDNIHLEPTGEWLYDHIDTSDIHIPSGLRSIIEKSRTSSTDTLITIADAAGATTDYPISNESTIKSVIQTNIEPPKAAVPTRDYLFLRYDSLRRSGISQYDNGVNGLVDDSSSTATLGYGYYIGDTSPSTIETYSIIDISGQLQELAVDAIFLKDSTVSDITYDTHLDGTQTNTGLLLGETYDISADYAAYGLTSTDLKLTFNIPASSGGDYWQSKTAHPLTVKNNRLIPVNNRTLLSVINFDLYQYISLSDSWTSLSGPTGQLLHTAAHPAFRKNGLRTIPATAQYGENYSLSTNSWTKISNGASSTGRPVEISDYEFYNIAASITTRFIDSANVTTTTTGVGDGFSNGAAFRGRSNSMHVHGGSSTADSPYTNKIRSFNFTTEAWANGATSATDQAFQAYAQLGTKKLHSICGLSGLSTYINNNNEYDETLETWSAKQANTTALKSPAAGVTRDDKILLINGETSAPADSDLVTEYTPDSLVKILGFGVKLNYSVIYTDADHVGYWTDDTAVSFFEADEAEKAASGYWTEDDGTIGGAIGTWWGYYWVWAAAGHPDFASSTFDEKLQAGYWSDINGKIGVDDGPAWG